MAPQIIWIALLFIGLFNTAYMHGKPMDGKYNFWVRFFSSILSILLLWWGGFFEVFIR